MKIVAMITAVGALVLGCERDSMEVRTFALERLEPDEAAALIEPYIYGDRDGAASVQLCSSPATAIVRPARHRTT